MSLFIMKKIDEITDREDVAELLGFKESAVTFILYKIPDSEKYTQWEIPKKGGGSRTIKSPCDKLKLLQTRLAEKLYEKYEEIIDIRNKKESSLLSHGYIREYSIITNARKHKRRRYVFNIDIKDFFPSINFGRVRGYFINSNHFKLPEAASTALAQIICYENQLPQGSPTSPVMSNLIGHLIDLRLAALAKKARCAYSRYVDDITFSTNMKTFPREIAVLNDENQWIIGNSLRKEIERAGFQYNPKKISMQCHISRQVVTGLVINEKINVKSEYYSHVRTCCHELFAGRKCFDITKSKDGTILKQPIGMSTLEGRLSFLYHIKISSNKGDPENKANNAGIIKTFQRFLIFKYFIANDKPIIFFEGKSDPIYIRYALQRLSEKFPKLITINEGKIDYHISLVSISGNLKKLFNLPTGCTGLDKLEQAYFENKRYFNVDIGRHPVVLVYDNDEGAKSIKGKMKTICKVDTLHVRADKPYPFRENVFVLFSIAKENGTIEDLFNPSLLEIKLDGKSFSKKNDFDPNTHFGKNDFAKKIIGPRRKEIDFSGFEPFLSALESLMT